MKEIKLAILWTLGWFISIIIAPWPFSLILLFTDTPLAETIVTLLSLLVGSVLGWVLLPVLIPISNRLKLEQKHPLVVILLIIGGLFFVGFLMSFVYSEIFQVRTNEGDPFPPAEIMAGILFGVLLRSIYDSEIRPKGKK